MFNMALIIALVSFAIFVSTYALYIILVLRNRKNKDYIQLINEATMKSLNPQSLPNVTVIVPAYNEEAVISRKLKNISELNYPIEKIEVLLVDDCSTDRTCEIAQSVLNELGLPGKIIRNPNRIGVNASYNKGVPNANSSFILRTDADMVIDAGALEKAVKIFSDIENIGGITGTMAPVTNKITAATRIENSYKSLFDQMSTAESALHSTFPGGGGFALLKKSSFSQISIDRGSTDGNISLSIIKKGCRYIYVPYAFSYETLSNEVKEQLKQKLRRATRLIQSAVMNKDILFRREFQEFGMIIFPLRFAMLTICPVLMLAGIVSAFLAILSFSFVIAISLTVGVGILLFLGSRTDIRSMNLLACFVVHQFYLLFGLLFLSRRMSTWKKIER